MTDTRDTIRDAARDTGNAINRAMPETNNTMNMVMMVVGAAEVLLIALYALGAFSPSTTTDAMNDTTAPAGITAPSN